jgi:argininosuccinate synthase
MAIKKKKVVLAFSGGLDTTYCAIYLSRTLDLEVHAVTINTGGFSSSEVKAIESHARALGVASFKCIDETEKYYADVIKYMIYGNVLRNSTYPLSVSAERITQAVSVAGYARKIKADFVAHGSTGAGNDQVRFDMVFNILIPGIKILAPIRDQKISRESEIEFLKENGVKMNFEKSKYSINKGLWGTSVGGRETLTSGNDLPEGAFPSQLKKTKPKELELRFTKGELRGINDTEFRSPVEAILALQEIAAPYAIGRDIHVGDTIIGIKGRVGFEAAAPLIIIKAHHLLEKHVLTKWQLYWKDQLAQWYGNWLHEGQFLDPVMRNLEDFMKSTQENVSGKVFVTLSPYHFHLKGIESKHDLMNPQFGSYGEMNNTWTGEDVKGFAKIFGNQTSIYYKINGDGKD